MAAANELVKLPQELMDHIVGHIVRKKDVSSLSKCSRGLYWSVSEAFFARAFDDLAKSKGLHSALCIVFIHAAKTDSQNLIRWAIYSKHASKLRGSFTPLENIDIVQSALLFDAPKMATYLVKQGVNFDESMALYPDLKPLYDAISRPISTSLGALDGPLRTACSYALPRTVEYLLTRGADPNTYSPFGYTALHVAMMRKLPWSRFRDFALPGKVDTDDGAEPSHGEVTCWPEDLKAEATERALVLEKTQWGASVAQTVGVLLRFGADHNLPTQTAYRHQCSHKCWKSGSCAPLEQRPLHLAAAAGHTLVVSLLINRRASVFQKDEQGNLPVVRAMAQDHEDIVRLLFKAMKKYSKKESCFNPIVCTTTKSTALHVACRFGYWHITLDLLERGAEVNGVDTLGQTPLHEALRQEAHDLEDDLVEILHTLVNYRANPDAVDLSGKRARDLGEKHRLPGVRGLFEYATFAKAEYERLTRGTNTEEVYVPPPPGPNWRVGEPEETPIYKKRISKKATQWVTKESFPALKGAEPQAKTAGAAGLKETKVSPTAQKAREAAQKAKSWLSGARETPMTATSSTNSVWGAQKIAKPVGKAEVVKTVEKTEDKRATKGSRQKKWVKVSLED